MTIMPEYLPSVAVALSVGIAPPSLGMRTGSKGIPYPERPAEAELAPSASRARMRTLLSILVIAPAPVAVLLLPEAVLDPEALTVPEVLTVPDAALVPGAVLMPDSVLVPEADWGMVAAEAMPATPTRAVKIWRRIVKC